MDRLASCSHFFGFTDCLLSKDLSIFHKTLIRTKHQLDTGLNFSNVIWIQRRLKEPLQTFLTLSGERDHALPLLITGHLLQLLSHLQNIVPLLLTQRIQAITPVWQVYVDPEESPTSQSESH